MPPLPLPVPPEYEHFKATVGALVDQSYGAEGEEAKAQLLQMLLDGHSATSVAERLGLSGPNLLYRWKRELIGQAGETAETLDGRVRELEAELRRVQQERDILKKALAIFGREE